MKGLTRISFTTLTTLLLLCSVTFAQSTKIRGKIIDASTKEIIPFVNIIFQGTSIGTITDFDGNYFLETRTPTDTLVISNLGYSTQKFKIKRNIFQTIDVELAPESISIGEVVIVPGENPAFRILRGIIAHKEQNYRENLEAYQCEVYNKIEMDANNITENFKSRRVFKQFQFIFEYLDTSVVSGSSYLPVFFIESLSDYYYKKNPKVELEVIKANKVSGIQNESISQFTGKMFMDYDLSDNYINVLGKGFISPIASFGRIYYKYYLIDSAFLDNQWCYQLSFKPRSKGEPTFTGDIWVHDTTFAIKRAQIRLSKDANVNWVNDFVVNLEYEMIDSSIWMLSKENLVVDFNVTEDQTIGFFGRKNTSYKNYVLNKPKEDDFYAGTGAERVKIEEDALEKDETFWQEVRHDSLTEREVGIYKMVDSIQDVPLFRTYLDVLTTIFTGYYELGRFEIGPYVKLYSFNDIEGHRIKIGGRTSLKFSERIFIEGHVAYGTKDSTFKYSLGARYHITKTPFSQFGLSYKDDLEQLGESPDALAEDNIFGSIFRRSNTFLLNHVIEYKGFYEKEWFAGLSNTLGLSHRILYPLYNMHDFQILNKTKSTIDTSYVAHFSTFEVSLITRFAYNEKFVIGTRDRISLGTTYPIIKIKYSYGIKNLFGSDFEYHKLKLYLSYRLNVNPLGYMKFSIGAGKVFGRLPYPLLEMHSGNETYWYDEESYSAMNYYEFVSDTYLEFSATHFFDGFFFNKIPLLKKLKLREVASIRGIWGYLSEENETYMVFEPTLSGLNSYKPYLEGGVGVENIFKVLRIDALWRLSYLSQDYIDSKPGIKIMTFGIRAKMNFKL